MVYPSSPGLNLQKIDLLLIKRAAQKKGFSIGIVSRSNSVKLLADDLSIPVFKSIKQAQRGIWAVLSPASNKFSERKTVSDIRKLGLDAKIKEPEWRALVGVRLIFFSLGVMAVLLIFLLFIPSAEVKLNLPVQIQTITLHVTADETVDEVNLSGVIPVHTIIVSVEETGLVDVNTTNYVPDKYATGKILFTNLTENQIEIPLGTIITRLDNTGIRFEVTEKGDVPAEIGQTIELQIRALTPGVAGNVEAYSLGSLIGDLGTSLSAINPVPTYGGSDRLTKMPDQSDRDGLFSLVEAELIVKAIQTAQAQISAGDIIFPDTSNKKEGFQENFVPAPGQPGDRLALNLSGSLTMEYAEYADLLRLAKPALTGDLPEDYEPLTGSPIEFELLEKPASNLDGTTTLELQVTRKIIKVVDPLIVSNQIKGSTISEAYGILKNEFGTEIDPGVKVTPSWWPWLPIVTLRIAILG